jgi:hypothetical protein
MASRGHRTLLPTELRDARVQLHWAAQVLSAAADRWLPAQPERFPALPAAGSGASTNRSSGRCGFLEAAIAASHALIASGAR